MALSFLCFFFFFNDTATTEIYTLSLHDALPIWNRPVEAPATTTVTHARPCVRRGRRDRCQFRPAAKVVAGKDEEKGPRYVSRPAVDEIFSAPTPRSPSSLSAGRFGFATSLTCR